MKENRTGLRRWIAGAGVIALLVSAGSAGAVSRGMVGSLGVFNPSTLAPFYFEGGVRVWGKKQGIYPPNAGAVQVEAVGATAATAVGRPVTLMAGLMNLSGGKFRDFPSFPTVGQTIKTFMTDNAAATFMIGGGALAQCPGGAGCNGVNGGGPRIEYCPPSIHNPANPAPGTVANKVGNWQCNAYGAAGAGNSPKRFVIKTLAGRNKYGGTLTLLHSQNQNVWRVRNPPTTPMANNAEVERSWMSVMNVPWTPGRPNFEYNTIANANGPRIRARLNANGAVEQTFGCFNGVGTVGVGKAFNGIPDPGGPFVPILGPGGPTPGACGTNLITPNPPGQGWGFKATTGTISGSDIFPFSTETTMLGTPFNPNRVPLVFGQGFFFTRMGDDSVSGAGANQVRNIVLLGGGIAFDPGSGNAYDRMSTLRMKLHVPEPAGAVGLLVGAGALLGLGWRRRSL